MALWLMAKSHRRSHIVLAQERLVVLAVADSCLFGVDGGEGGLSRKCVCAIKAHGVTMKKISRFGRKLVPAKAKVKFFVFLAAR
jgi:hypothetical protein